MKKLLLFSLLLSLLISCRAGIESEINGIKQALVENRTETNQQFKDVESVVISNADPAWMRLIDSLATPLIVVVFGIQMMKLKNRGWSKVCQK